MGKHTTPADPVKTRYTCKRRITTRATSSKTPLAGFIASRPCNSWACKDCAENKKNCRRHHILEVLGGCSPVLWTGTKEELPRLLARAKIAGVSVISFPFESCGVYNIKAVLTGPVGRGRWDDTVYQDVGVEEAGVLVSSMMDAAVAHVQSAAVQKKIRDGMEGGGKKKRTPRPFNATGAFVCPVGKDLNRKRKLAAAKRLDEAERTGVLEQFDVSVSTRRGTAEVINAILATCGTIKQGGDKSYFSYQTRFLDTASLDRYMKATRVSKFSCVGSESGVTLLTKT